MKTIDVIHDDGRRARMTERRFAAVQAEGWQLADPRAVVDSTDSNIEQVLADVGVDPVKAAAAIELETAGKNRPTLISKLAAIVDGSAESTGVTPEKEQ